MKEEVKRVIMPPITIRLWERDLLIMISALRAYWPEDKTQQRIRDEALDMLLAVAEDH